ncbi:hypothetical protein SeLEV6574_g01756 [Synchytrium endobioticum]|uniref:Uncharacterized protein n=1 Tax=Synchytrium endobioticum TaxID=286115 RepID=A0A507DB59_9FUNG|nr:hypothetical protein SeLEV6574_g01756 [Synchytrium endobioticum]
MEREFRKSVYTKPKTASLSLPPYDWKDVDPTLSRLEQQYRAESPNNPASRPVPIFRYSEVDTWLDKIKEMIAGYQAKIDYNRHFHGATVRDILSHDPIRPDLYESTAGWGCLYKYEDLRRLASEYQIWQPLLQAHTKLIIQI